MGLVPNIPKGKPLPVNVRLAFWTQSNLASSITDSRNLWYIGISQESEITSPHRRRGKMSISGEDEDFVSARTHLSNDDESFHHGTSNAAEIPSPFRNRPSSDEPSRLLSDEENQALDEKIDRLMAAIQDGRQLHFSPDAQTGNVNISADFETQNLVEEVEDVEAGIAASPENFGTVIRPGDHHRRIRSISSLITVGSTLSDQASKESSYAWERSVAADNVRYALEHDPALEDPTVVMKLLPPRPARMETNNGRTLAFMDRGQVKVRTISPISLNYDKPPRLLTPSIQSDGSEVDCGSPLFENSMKMLLKDIDGATSKSPTSNEALEAQDLKDTISSWLSRVRTPRRLENKASAKGKERAFGVFEDDRGEDFAGQGIQKPIPATQALKDISNLRRPGYLQKNSFAKEKALDVRSVHPGQLGSPFQPFGGASGRDSRRKFIEKRWPALLAGNKDSKEKNLTQIGPRSRLNLSNSINQSQQSQPPNYGIFAEQAAERYQERTVDFDFTLARLEGRVPPPPSSPIRRYAMEKDVYGSDVELEHCRIRRWNPRPRVKHHGGIKKLEAAIRADGQGDGSLGVSDKQKEDASSDIRE